MIMWGWVGVEGMESGPGGSCGYGILLSGLFNESVFEEGGETE